MNDRTETPGRHQGDTRETAGRHSEGSKNSYMDQCTFGAGPLRGARGETVSKRPAKKSEHARIFLFSFAQLTLNVKHGREIVPDGHRRNSHAGLALTVFAMGPSL